MPQEAVLYQRRLRLSLNLCSCIFFYVGKNDVGGTVIMFLYVCLSVRVCSSISVQLNPTSNYVLISSVYCLTGSVRDKKSINEVPISPWLLRTNRSVLDASKPT